MVQSSAFLVGQLLGLVLLVVIGAVVMAPLLRLAAYWVVGHATPFWPSWKASLWSILLFGGTFFTLAVILPEIRLSPRPSVEIPCLMGIWALTGRLFGSKLEDENGVPVGFGRGAFVSVVVLGLCVITLFFYGLVVAWGLSYFRIG